ncbi:hypothetical protein LOAG_15028 [Loa loa]|uniref:G-protein coupled receptors family 1 profile domain-containing protein n=1 Tax=Loa loa TaxID=7209 RepID=A0A1S0TGM5_LOALO|nr:hypothetical protein LOAG_15028 [Loa loa]EFO13501.1 hypothetical protein LOAG_15028 [Loa loa]
MSEKLEITEKKMSNLTSVAIFMVPLLILGMFGNLNLIYATWKFKELRNRNSLLVAIIAIFDFMAELHLRGKDLELKTLSDDRSDRSTIEQNIFDRRVIEAYFVDKRST